MFILTDACVVSPQVICREILALYRRPKKFLEDLEKEVMTLREKLALVSVCQLIHVTTLKLLLPLVLCVGSVLQKKQVEIKEVNVKKAGSVVSSNTGKLLLHVHVEQAPL